MGIKYFTPIKVSNERKYVGNAKQKGFTENFNISYGNETLKTLSYYAKPLQVTIFLSFLFEKILAMSTSLEMLSFVFIL